MRMSIDTENLLSAPLPMRELRESAASSKLHINPSVLVIVIILSVVFLCSGILHILARCLGRRRARQPSGGGGLNGSSPSNNSLRGQLQHLFSLHDSGVEQVFIDTLPVFLYGSIRGLKDSADCAVCLTEFANEDKLRLLPKCKHAFHTECIDTWLLSNSTCPLCRRSLLPDTDPIVTTCTPDEPQQQQQATTHGASFRGSFRASLRGSFRFLTETITPAPAPVPPSLELAPPTPPMTPGPTVSVPQPDGSEKTLRVELGRVNVDRIDTTTSRMARSYSMGSYEYVVDLERLGLAGSSSSQQPMHRTTLSDGIPELCSAGHTPGQEDLFWASRGLDTPHSLSRVREIMTPSPGWNSSPFASQKQKRNVNLEEEEEEDDDDDDDEGGEIKAFLTRVKKSNSNSNLNTSVEMVEYGSANVSTSLEVKDALTRLKKANRNPNSNTSVEMVESAVGNANVSTSVEVKDALTRLKKANPNPNLNPSVEMVESAVAVANVSTSVEVKDALTRLKKANPNPNSNPSVEMVGYAVADATHRSVEKQDDDEDEEVLKGKQYLPRDLSVALMRSPVQELGAASRKDKVWEVSVDVSEPERSPSSKKSSPLNWLRGRGRRLVYSAASPSATDLQEQQLQRQQQQQSTEVTNT